MNNTSNLTAPVFTFTVGDGVYVTLQGFNFFIFILVGILLFIFRKEKELKFRSWLPYFSIFGLFILSFRLGIGNVSFLKIGNSLSYTYR
jgi:hypothetical protein